MRATAIHPETKHRRLRSIFSPFWWNLRWFFIIYNSSTPRSCTRTPLLVFKFTEMAPSPFLRGIEGGKYGEFSRCLSYRNMSHTLMHCIMTFCFALCCSNRPLTFIITGSTRIGPLPALHVPHIHYLCVTKWQIGLTKTIKRSNSGFWCTQLAYLVSISYQTNQTYKEVESKAKSTCSSGD